MLNIPLMTLRELLSNIADYFGEIFGMIAEVPSSFVNSFLDAPLTDILLLVGMLIFLGVFYFGIKAYGEWLNKWIDRFERPWVRFIIYFPINPFFMVFYVATILIAILVLTGLLD